MNDDPRPITLHLLEYGVPGTRTFTSAADALAAAVDAINYGSYSPGHIEDAEGRILYDHEAIRRAYMEQPI